jgi:hypothetical protein
MRSKRRPQTDSIHERSCDTSLIGRAKELEVAGMLIQNGIYVFWPLIDTGADLLATNRDASSCIPVQVKYRAKASSLGLNKADAGRFDNAKTVLAFLVGEDKWFLPYEEWRTKAVDKRCPEAPDRRDKRLYVPLKKNKTWLEQFKGDDGIQQVFAELLPGNPHPAAVKTAAALLA